MSTPGISEMAIGLRSARAHKQSIVRDASRHPRLRYRTRLQVNNGWLRLGRRDIIRDGYLTSTRWAGARSRPAQGP